MDREEGKPQMHPLVREFFRRVHEKVQDQELIDGIRPMIRKQDYKRGAPYQWRDENANPSLEVALAAARLTGLSLDELVFGELRASQVEEWQHRTDERLAQFEERLEQVAELLESRLQAIQDGSARARAHPTRPSVE